MCCCAAARTSTRQLALSCGSRRSAAPCRRYSRANEVRITTATTTNCPSTPRAAHFDSGMLKEILLHNPFRHAQTTCSDGIPEHQPRTTASRGHTGHEASTGAPSPIYWACCPLATPLQNTHTQCGSSCCHPAGRNNNNTLYRTTTQLERTALPVRPHCCAHAHHHATQPHPAPPNHHHHHLKPPRQ